MIWPAHWLAAGAVSVLELDGVAVGQFMLSRPLVVGPVLGVAFGHPDQGLLIGAVIELLGLSELPVGGHLPLNGTVACAGALLLAFGPVALPLELSLPAGLVAGWLHSLGESALRQRRAALCRVVEVSVSQGARPLFAFLSARSLARQACWTAFVLAVALGAAPVLSWVWLRAPETLKAGLSVGLAASPCLAAASLLSALWVKR